MSEELKPCPFCGHADMYFDHHLVQPDNLNGGMWRCSRCDSSGSDGDYWHDSEDEAKADAAKKWNTRHIPEGYALVPVEPTDAMKESFFGLTFPERASITPIHLGDFSRRYKAMIAAAKAQPE